MLKLTSPEEEETQQFEDYIIMDLISSASFKCI